MLGPATMPYVETVRLMSAELGTRVTCSPAAAFQQVLAQDIGHHSGPKNACRSAASWAGASIAGKCLPRGNSVQCAVSGAGTSLRTVWSAPKTAKPCGTAGGAPQSAEWACSYRVCAAVAPE